MEESPKDRRIKGKQGFKGREPSMPDMGQDTENASDCLPEDGMGRQPKQKPCSQGEQGFS